MKMKNNIKYLLFVIILHSVYSWKTFSNKNGFFLGEPSKDIETTGNFPKEYYFEQNLCHFNYSETKTWKQRYYVNEKYYKPGGPVFIMITGEKSQNWITEGAWIKYAKKFNAICFLLEHGYYGESRPEPDLSTKSLDLLLVESALGDVTTFTGAMIKKFNLGSDSKWIAFGGSYSGTLAAWLRVKYPHIIDGAVTSSAPIMAIEDFYEYYDMVGKALATNSYDCADAIEKAMIQIELLLADVSEAKSLNGKFLLCDPIENSLPNRQDLMNLFENLASNIAFIVEYNKVNSLHAKLSIDDICTINIYVLELRKEKSRDAARSRRGKENYEYYELAKMLPLPGAITSQLDKASIIRLTISYLKLRDFSGHGNPPWQRENTTSKLLKSPSLRQSPAVQLFEQHQGTHILQSLDGFALAVAADGRFLYISETVSIYLGLSQVELTGSSVFDYVHLDDHAEMAEHLGLSLRNTQRDGNSSPASRLSDEGGEIGETLNPDVTACMSLTATSAYKGYDRAFCVRMKSTLTKRGCHFKSSGYRVVLMLCRLRPQHSFAQTKKVDPQLLGMVALAIALPPPTVHEIRLECDMFVTRINFDFRIAHCEPKVTELLDYTPEELTGKSLYNLCHGEDSEKLRKAHMDLISKGQVLTYYYRIMNKNGGYTWLQTCATIVCSIKNADEQSIICVNYVVSLRENEHLILDSIQLEGGLEETIKSEVILGDHNETAPIDVECNPESKTLSIEIPAPLKMNTENKCEAIVKEPDNIPKAIEIPTPKKRGRKRKVKDNEEISAVASANENTTSSQSKIENYSKKSKSDQTIIESSKIPSPHEDAIEQYKPIQEKSSTIQWIGNSSPNAYTTPIPSASSLLSQLYAKINS